MFQGGKQGLSDELRASMYAVKVRLTDQAKSTEPGEESGPSLPSNREAGCDTGTIQVSAGNPRVEHVTGLIHLYRELGDRGRGAGGPNSSLPVSDPLRTYNHPA